MRQLSVGGRLARYPPKAYTATRLLADTVQPLMAHTSWKQLPLLGGQGV